MHIQLSQPFAFSYIGQRSINQDTLFPPVNAGNEQDQLFLVCDGIGGADKGEVASRLLCDGLVTYINAMGMPVLDMVHMRAALEQVYATYYKYLNRHLLISRMGSTLAMLQFHRHGASVIHIGDSRIYQLRSGKIIFQTKDHKQVNDMVDAGILSKEQARVHPWRNRLSRAVVASIEDNKQHVVHALPDITELTDIKAGDYFFLCTDGVLEQVNENHLETVLGSDISDQMKIYSLLALCEGKTKDNYSAYLIGVHEVIASEDTAEKQLASR